MAAEPVRWLNDGEQQLWRRLLSVECRLRERLDRELREGAGLTLGEYEVLVHLSEAPDAALRMSELAGRLLLSRSGLTRRVDGLVRQGLVARKPCDDDGRGAMAALTPLGLEQLEHAAPLHVRGVRRYLFDPLSGDVDAGEGAGESAGTDGQGADPHRLDGLVRGLARIERTLDGN